MMRNASSEKKKRFSSFLFFYISFCYVAYSDEPCGRRSTALKSPGGIVEGVFEHPRLAAPGRPVTANGVSLKGKTRQERVKVVVGIK